MENNAKNFVLQLGSLLSLYISITALVLIVFNVTNILLPDPLATINDAQGYGEGIRYGIAWVIVFFPAYLVLTYYVNKARHVESNGSYLGLTRWLIYLSLLIGGGVLLGDLVFIIINFLHNALTTAFLIKALALIVIIGTAGTYYILDARAYWKKHAVESKYYAMGSVVIVLLTIIIGFSNVVPPPAQRDILLDRQRLGDLGALQNAIGQYYQVKQELPGTLDDLLTLSRGGVLPADPVSGASYDYATTSDTGFKLCATFSAQSQPDDVLHVIATPGINSNWEHQAGYTCYDRTLDPAFYTKAQLQQLPSTTPVPIQYQQ